MTKTAQELPVPSCITISMDEYQTMVSRIDKLYNSLCECQEDLKQTNLRLKAKEASNDFLISESIKSSLRYQTELSRRDSKIGIMSAHIWKHLEEIEAAFDTNEELSPEACDDYLISAKYQRDHFGRNSEAVLSMIERIQAHRDKLPWS